VVQLIHRVFGVAVLVMVSILWVKARKSTAAISIAGNILMALVVIQFLLGVFTLIYAVPITLGVLHQLGAVLVVFSIIHLMFITRPDGLPIMDEKTIVAKQGSFV